METGFLNWGDIFNEKVEIINQGRRGVKHSLHFQYPGGPANIEITEYAKRSQLEGLMRCTFNSLLQYFFTFIPERTY